MIFEIGPRDPRALSAALYAALGNTVIRGISTDPYGVRVFFIDTPTQQQIDTAQAVIDAHDPVFIEMDTTRILANGTDTATVTVTAPKPGAAPVVLDINGQQEAVALVDGVGQVEIVAADPLTVTVRVVDPENRSNEVLTIQAVE